MGLTDNENPLGLMPFLMPGLGSIGRRKKREDLPEPHLEPKDIHGGERQERSKTYMLDRADIVYDCICMAEPIFKEIGD
jgi:hypothetical protein